MNGACLKIRLAQSGDTAATDLDGNDTSATDSVASGNRSSDGRNNSSSDSGSSNGNIESDTSISSPAPGSLLAFRKELAAQCSHKGPQESVLIVNFSRAAIQQTGGGHFSPVRFFLRCLLCHTSLCLLFFSLVS